MALVKCKDCGKDVSTDAKTCPNCGANRTRTPEEEERWQLYLAAKAERDANRPREEAELAAALEAARREDERPLNLFENVPKRTLFAALSAAPLFGLLAFIIYAIALWQQINKHFTDDARRRRRGIFLVLCIGYVAILALTPQLNALSPVGMGISALLIPSAVLFAWVYWQVGKLGKLGI